MAESYFTWLVSENGLAYAFEIDSAATSREEIGNGPHRGTVSELKKHGIPVIPHKARQMTISDAQRFDLLIGMDEENLWYMERITGGQYKEKMHLLLEFKKDGSVKTPAREVDDPWYTGNFKSTYKDVEEGCAGLLSYCAKKYKLPASPN